MKILVTGAKGFVGQNLVASLKNIKEGKDRTRSLEIDEIYEYDLGDEEFHLALTTENYEEAYKKHKEMGVIIYENPAMGIYFIGDPDGYWIEIVPAKK